MKFNKYGRTWYTERSEAEDNRKDTDLIYYDKDAKAYYIIKRKKKSFWDF